MTAPTYALRLEAEDGTTRDVGFDFDLDALTPTERTAAYARWDQVDPTHLAASLLFARTGLPETEWPMVGPVLQGAITGTVEIEVTHGL